MGINYVTFMLTSGEYKDILTQPSLAYQGGSSMNPVPNSAPNEQTTIQNQPAEAKKTSPSAMNKGYSEGVTGRKAVSTVRVLSWLLFAGFVVVGVGSALPAIASLMPGIVPAGQRGLIPMMPWGIALLQLLWAAGWVILGGLLCAAFLVLAAIGEHVIAIRERLVP